LTVVGRFELCRRDVGVVLGDLSVQRAVVEPVDVDERGVLDVVEASPRSPPHPDRYPAIPCCPFQPAGAKSGRFRTPWSKTDKTAPGRGATRHSVDRSPADEYEGRDVRSCKYRGEHDEQ
jgi:hypothetical protein